MLVSMVLPLSVVSSFGRFIDFIGVKLSSWRVILIQFDHLESPLSDLTHVVLLSICQCRV